MYAAMTDAEKEGLHKWEKEYIGVTTKATSDWPGWAGVTARLSH